MAVKDQRQFWAGIVFLVFGAATLSQLPHYTVGSATQMGPGYFPMLVGAALVIFGAIASWRATVTGEPVRVGPWPVTQLLFVTLGVIAFAFLIERAGLIASVFCLVALSCYERLLRKPLEVLAIFVAIAALSSAVFIYGIGLPIALW